MNTPDFQRDYSINEVETGSVKAFMNRVFGLMSIALLISGFTAFQFSETMMNMLMSGGTMMMYALMFAPWIQQIKPNGLVADLHWFCSGDGNELEHHFLDL